MAMKVPSFWDYLGEGLDRGIQGYQGRKADQRAEKERQLSLMTNLFGAGAIDSADLNDALRSSGIKGNVQANAAEMRRKIMANRERQIELPNMFGTAGGAAAQLPGQTLNIPAKEYSDDERSFAGLPTSFEQRKQRSEGLGLDVNDRINQIRQRFAAGQPISDTDAELAGVSTPEQRQTKRLEAIEKPLASAASRYVSEAVLGTNGRLEAKQLTTLADQAFEAWKMDRAGGGQMNLTPDEESHARAYFADSVRSAFIEQQDMDIKRIVANAQRDRVENQGQGSPAAMVNALGAVAAREQKAADAMLEGAFGIVISSNIGKPIEQVDPRYREQVQAYNDRINRAIQANNASARYAAGQIAPDEAVALLAGFGSEGAPQATMTPQPGQAPPSSVPNMSSGQMDQASSMLRQMQKADRKTYADGALYAGQITQSDYDKLKKQVGW